MTSQLEMRDLLRAIDEDGGNLANWHPLADWLIERDDPRGELINIDLALEGGTADRDRLAERRTQILAEFAPQLLGETFARMIADGYGTIAWRRGFVDEVGYRGDPSLGHLKAVGWLVKLMTTVHEPFSLMRKLDLSYTDIKDLKPLEQFPHLERLGLEGCTQKTEQSLGALLKLRPRLLIFR